MSGVPPRPRHSLRFADGERLELGRRTAVMGILNVTPDSFSDGGRFDTVTTAGEHGLAMARDGAAIIDVGGESSRPGAAPVGVDEEIDRVVPVIEGLRCRSYVRISIKCRLGSSKYSVGPAPLAPVSTPGPVFAPTESKVGP